MNYDLSKLTGASSTELPFIAERLSSERAYQKVMRRLIVSIKQAVNDNVLPNLGDVIDASNGQLESDISLDNLSDDGADAVGGVV